MIGNIIKGTEPTIIPIAKSPFKMSVNLFNLLILLFLIVFLI